MKTIQIMVPQNKETNGFLPWSYLFLKNFYEHRGNYEFNWIDPLVGYISDDEFWQHLLDNPPDVFGIGCYLWNTDTCYEMAEKVKEKWPECFIVAGGPNHDYLGNPNFFNDHPYIDILVPLEGEQPFTSVLDMYMSGDEKWEECPGIVYPTDDAWKNSALISYTPGSEIEWPGSVILDQAHIIKKYIKHYNDIDTTFIFLYETARGCPYQCTFCDWGGGTFSKIRKKPMDVIEQEIEWMSDNGVSILSLINANFGIIKEDVQVAEMVVAGAKRTGYPKFVDTLQPKKYTDKAIQISKMFAKQNLIKKYVISIQDLTPDVLDNIKRTEITWDEHLQNFENINNEVPIGVTIGTMVGLPGQSLTTLINDVDTLLERNVPYPSYAPWVMLPNSPAAKPAYIEKFKIDMSRSRMPAFPTATKANVDNNARDWGHARVTIKNRNDSTINLVTSTYSFCKEEYVDMLVFTGMMTACATGGVTRLISLFLRYEHDIKFSTFYGKLFNVFFKEKAIGVVHDMYAIAKYQLTKELSSDIAVLEIDQTNLPQEFPLLLPMGSYWSLSMLWWKEELFDQLMQWLPEEFPEVDANKLHDIGRYNSGILYSNEYDPNVGRDISCEFDWLDWMSQFDKVFVSPPEIRAPRKHECNYHVGDDTTSYLGHILPIEWHTHTDKLEILMDFYYKTSCNPKSSRHFKDITRTNAPASVRRVDHVA